MIISPMVPNENDWSGWASEWKALVTMAIDNSRTNRRFSGWRELSPTTYGPSHGGSTNQLIVELDRPTLWRQLTLLIRTRQIPRSTSCQAAVCVTIHSPVQFFGDFSKIYLRKITFFQNFISFILWVTSSIDFRAGSMNSMTTAPTLNPYRESPQST